MGTAFSSPARVKQGPPGFDEGTHARDRRPVTPGVTPGRQEPSIEATRNLAVQEPDEHTLVEPFDHDGGRGAQSASVAAGAVPPSPAASPSKSPAAAARRELMYEWRHEPSALRRLCTSMLVDDAPTMLRVAKVHAIWHPLTPSPHVHVSDL